MNKSFTLIEILVVIVIIGIISGFIIVSMSGVSNKATVAKGRVFSNSLRNSLLINLVSEWKFDGVSGTVGQALGDGTAVPDSWGANSGLTYNGPILRNGNDCLSGKCLYFDGTNDYVNCGNGSTLNMTTAITISFWFNPYYSGSSEQLILYKGGPGFTSDGWRVGTKDGYVRLHYWDGATSRSVGNINYATNQWTSVVFSNNVGNSFKTYINGSLFGVAGVFSEGLVVNAVDFLMAGQPTYNFNGLLDEVMLYNKEISLSQVQQNYFAGLNKLFKNNMIVLEEFNQRVAELKNNKNTLD
ncbi:MAG: LamG domain-containing protein [Candidatus Pacebacteria bacterium]|nr:LamG domain-containing protein [Candidatus Paceibacterota bacterium]